MRIEADMPQGTILRNVHTSVRFRKGPFGWQEIDLADGVVPYEYPLPCIDMQRYIQLGCMEACDETRHDS